MAGPASTSQNATSDSEVDPTDHLPLSLLRSELIPPAANRSESSIDWLPDFAGYSWVAYGSSSLLVISHFPSPLSSEQTLMGPIFRQVFELSSGASSTVSAVSWSPVTPSTGEIAAASENCICLFSHDCATSNSKGSFCWSQNAVLLQCSKVEAVEWTASGDGIIAGGFELVLWKRKSKSWEIAWKFRADKPQNMVSASWSIEGPSASASYSKDIPIEGGGFSEPSKSVLIFYRDGSSGFAKALLGHPQPVSMIQWRPSAGKQFLRDSIHLRRHILLTCCLDGTVRLWSEIDSGRVKRAGKDGSYDHKTTRRSFSVAAVIEIDCALRGTLGVDIFFRWAMEIDGIVKTSEETNQFICTEGYKHEAGRCEWLIGFGPGKLVTFWAILCLDDISPMRFPRVTLWKRHELQGLEVEHLHRNGRSTLKQQLLLKKAVIMRNYLSGPPTVCSLVHLFPCKSLTWSMLYTKTSNDAEDASPRESRTENLLSCSAGGILDIDGHTREILQVAIHPYVCDIELAVSLDSNGLLLFWSLSTHINGVLDLPTLVPAWRICGKHETQDKCSRYTSLSWAPFLLAEDRVLLMGHVGGIDCFAIKIFHGEEDDLLCNYMCTIPFTGHDPYEDGPANIYSVPLSLSCNKTSVCDRFLLLGIWMKEFRALSWEITMHAYELTGSYSECNFNDNIVVECSIRKFENTISGTRYCLHVVPYSAHLPEPHLHDQVTSFAVISPGGLTPVQLKLPVDSDPYSCKSPAYVMVTGCSDGSLKLWRCNPNEPSISRTQWELVGMFTAHQGPVSAICLTNCGRKIATIGSDSLSNAVRNLRIWDSIHLEDSGTFILEDTLFLDEDIVALNWLALGNGQLLLAVCMCNELRVYAQKRCGGHALLNSKMSLGMQIWFCIGISHTFSAIHDFLWGPRTTGVVVHANYLSLLSPWLFLLEKKHQTEFNPKFIPEGLLDSENGMDEGNLSEIFSDQDAVNHEETLIANGNGGCNSGFLKNMNTKNRHLSSRFLVGTAQSKLQSKILLGFWSLLDIVETLAGVLPVYHPEALFANIYSGNWKRAYNSVKHLVEYLNSSYISEKRVHHPKISDIIPQIPLFDYFEGTLSKGSTENAFQWSGNATFMTLSSQVQSGLSQFAYNLTPEASSNTFSLSSTKYGLRDFLEPINKLHELAAITATEKMQILAIIDFLNEVSNPQSASVYENLDEPGRRFWVTLRFQQLLFYQRYGRSASLEELVVDSELIAWAFHSECQETLFGSVLPNEPSWEEMRTLGVGFWFTNATQLRTRMEKLARMQYLKKKDPKDCTLLYVALNRLQVLAGLFKISKDEKDRPLVGFLSRNFQEEKNKAAALKNAYVLMGRHQLELAIAFFLLGGDISSAVTVCAKNLGDEQLALIICRLVEGRCGSLEHHLIKRLILPSAIERSDYWLASLLEWELGNHSQSFLTMLGLQVDSAIDASTLSSCHVAFMDPSIGLYCLTLANKNSMRNAVGDHNAGVLARWASLMTATSLNRCGLPLEALECLSSSLSILGRTDQENVSDFECSKTSLGSLKPFISDSSPWILGDVASHLDSYAKLDLALQYISKLMREHPSWPRTSIGSVGVNICSEDYDNQYEKILETFQHKLHSGLVQFEQKFSLVSYCLINMIFVSLCNNGFWFLGYDILNGYFHKHSHHENHIMDNSFWYPLLHKPLLKVTEDISLLFMHFIAACSITWSPSKSCFMENGMSHEVRSNWVDAWECYFQGVKLSLCNLRAAMRIFSGIFNEVLTPELLTLLDLYEYYVHFASAWLQKNSEGLVLMMQPLLITFTNGHTPYDVDMSALKKMSHQVLDTVTGKTLTNDLIGSLEVDRCAVDKQVGELLHSIPEVERWHIIGTFLWQHLSRFMKHKLNSLAISDDNYPSGFSHGELSSCAPGSSDFGSDRKSIREKIRSSSWILAKLLKTALEHISSYHVKQLGLFLRQKLDNGFRLPTLVWLEESRLSSSSRAPYQHLAQGKDITNSTSQPSASDILWNMCADPTIILESFAQEKINWSSCFLSKPSKGWGEVYKDIIREHESDESHNPEGRTINSCSSGGDAGSPSKGVLRNGHTFLSSWQKDTNMEKEVTPYQNPKEIYKRNGELLEALCVNSIDQRQTALASNRKGIIFFNWEDGIPYIDQSDYIWSVADWPHNGWAGCESTPIPTCVSPGVGLGNKKGAHLGLGGATIGVGSFARPGRDLTGGGAFGIPGYAGMGASGLGWEMQEDFEEFVDPPATVENISTRAFSSHPSRPFFLVGSVNTHIYLWEYGKDKATATYGVLPAANVPPPYALASISALQFDHCGHRFATAALDGTVCTWQLEVGGRSNIRPTESSLCFNNHASDVTYVTSSGSIIAAAGYSGNGVNVVIWDTLAPPATSRASIICHEGGARSIAVFDNDIGSGSVSPLIVTGGKNGDVGLHDFRYIATGRTKRHKHHDGVETSINTSSADIRTGTGNQLRDQNVDGMLWYIPKAHSGSITKISTIPATSLFLTGSKDGDVKLWDAKAAKLVYHWSKLHERHTFLQPSSRGFGGVVQAAVTDIQVVSHGFLSCGGDGSVKLVRLNDYRHGTLC